MATPAQRRTWIIAILVLGVLAILVILWVLFRPLASPPVEDFEITDLQTGEIREEAPSVREVITPEAASAIVVTRNFVERFATFSSDIPYANYEDVRELTTDAFYSALLAGRSIDQPEEYIGVTARVLSLEQVAGDEALAFIDYDVTMQLEESRGDRASTDVRYAHGFVNVVKQGDSWLVNGFEWE